MRFSQAVGSAGWPLAGEVSPPAIWGKLPTHADYLQHGVRSDEVQGWQRWLAGQLRPQPTPCSAGKRLRRDEQWSALEPERYKPAPSSIPVAFVLPAGAVALTPPACVLGVIANSCDRLGREHPMLVYQRCNARWLQHCFASTGGSGEAATAFDDTSIRLDQQTWLFWLARLVSRYAAAPEEAASLREADDRTAAVTGVDMAETGVVTAGLDAAVAQLWSHYAPGWAQKIGIARARPTWMDMHALIGGIAPARACDAADDLHGVGHLPWADWPARLGEPNMQPVFWQQDAYGGYVGASRRLADLWERRQ